MGLLSANIDDNSFGTGYAFAFQPKVASGNLVGKSYAVFTISFVKTGTVTPVSLQSINATPLDLDGNATLKEFAEIGMRRGCYHELYVIFYRYFRDQSFTGNYRGQNIPGD